MQQSKQTPSVLYYKAVKTIFEAGIKLGANPLTIATSATLYHRFYQDCDPADYDPFLIAATSLYLGGKCEEDHFKIRDIINVYHKILHPNQEPLALGDDYWLLRDSVVRSELLMLRMLNFKVHVNNPHKYFLHYLRAIYDWLPTEVALQTPLANTCWSLLNDVFLSPVCLKYSPQHLSVGIIQLGLEIYTLEVPFSPNATYTWYEAFSEDLTMEKLREITKDLLYNYEEDLQLTDV